jgi:signal transduction histidine kinase
MTALALLHEGRSTPRSGPGWFAHKFGVNVSDQDGLALETERIRSVYEKTLLTLGISVVNAVLTVVVLAPVGSHRLLWIWVSLIVVVSVARLVGRQRFLRRAPDGAQNQRWVTLSVLGALANGVLWGVVATALSPAGERYQFFFAFVIGGMCAGTTAVNSAHLPTVLAFILPATLLPAASFLVERSTPRFISGLMILIFAAALSLTSLFAHRAFGERVRLHLALRRRESDLREANERLRAEMAERQQAEANLQQAQKMEAIGHLTGGMAHDFNNLLHVVSGHLGMIGRLADANPRIRSHLLAAEQAVRQSAALIGSLLAFARRQTLRVERVNLNMLLREFQPILVRALGDTIQLQMSLAPDLPICKADPGQFQSAILNLVINARDAIVEHGHVWIITRETMLGTDDLRANLDAAPGCFVSVAVRDDGSGMTAEVLARVFEPFFTTKEIGKGSGLGLSQVYGFARQSRGHLDVRSEPGAGTCVTLCLPIEEPQPT